MAREIENNSLKSLPHGFKIVTSPQKSKDEFEELPQGFNIISSPKESKKSEIPRHLLRSASRIAESSGGVIGDIQQLPLKLAASGIEKITESEKPRKFIESFRRMPTSEEIRDLSSSIFGEKINPQNEKEKLADNIISDAAVMAFPFKGKIPFLYSMGTAVGSNLAEFGAKKFGASQGVQNAVKMGTLFLGGLAAQPTIKKFWKNQYNLAEESIPKDAKVNTFGLLRKLDKHQDKLKGIPSESRKKALGIIRALRKKVSRGEANPKVLIDEKKALNEIRSGLYDKFRGKELKRTLREVNKIAEPIDEVLEAYGKKNPTFWKHQTNANEAFGAFQQSKKSSNWVRSILPIKKIPKAALLIAEAIWKPSHLLVSAPAYSVYKLSEVLARAFRNPTTKKFYKEMIVNAVKENKGAFLQNLNKLTKSIKKNDPKAYDKLTRQQDAD